MPIILQHTVEVVVATWLRAAFVNMLPYYYGVQRTRDSDIGVH